MQFELQEQIQTLKEENKALIDDIASIRQLSRVEVESESEVDSLKLQVLEQGEKLNELWSNMDKLWAAAWRRNQAEISELRKEIEKRNNQH